MYCYGTKVKKDDLLTFQEFKEFGLNIIQSLLKSWIAVLRSRPLNFSSIKLPINLCKLHSWWYLRWFQLILDPLMPRRNGLTKEILKVGCEAETAWMTSTGANAEQFSRPRIIFYTRQWNVTKFLTVAWTHRTEETRCRWKHLMREIIVELFIASRCVT